MNFRDGVWCYMGQHVNRFRPIEGARWNRGTQN